MMEVMDSQKGREALIRFAGSKGFTEGTRYVAYMNIVFEKSFRFHIIQAK